MKRLVAKSRLPHFVGKMNERNGYEITVAQLAKAIGINRRKTIYDWLTDRPIDRVDTETQGKLAEYFGVQPEDMIAYEWVDDAEDVEETKSLLRRTADLSAALPTQ